MVEMKTALEVIKQGVDTLRYCPPDGHHMCRPTALASNGGCPDCETCCDKYLRAHVKGYAEKYPEATNG